MFRKLKKVLVETFIGAIGLGWLFAYGILCLADVFSAPFTRWLARTEYAGTLSRPDLPAGPLLRDSLPSLFKFVCIFVVWYLLVRWLYYKPVPKVDSIQENAPLAD